MKKLLFILLLIPCLMQAQNYPFRGSIVPDTSGKRDIGLDTLFWRYLHVSELESSVFSKQAINLVGGYLRLGKNCGVLQSKVLTVSTTMTFETSMTLGDIVELRDGGNHEFVRVLSWQAGYNYYVARNLDGSGTNSWLKGTPYSVIGQNGNGWIDLTSYDKTRISMYAVHDTTYNNWNEILRIGDLNGNWGYSGESYGVVMGSYANNSSYLTFDTVNGIRLRHRNGYGISSNTLQLKMNGDAAFTGDITFTNAGSIAISGFNNDAGYITSASAGNHTYYQGTEPTGTSAGDFWFDTQTAGQYKMRRRNATTGGTEATRWDLMSVYMDANGIYAGNITAGQITAGTFTGFTFQTAASGKRVEIRSSDNEMEFYETSGSIVRIGSDVNGTTDGIKIANGSLYSITNLTTPALYGWAITNKGGTGGSFWATGTAGSGSNIAVYGNASGGDANYSFWGGAGNIYNAGDVNITGAYKINGTALAYSDVGAAASGHNHTGTYIPVGGESDPTIYSWAKASSKPSYTYSEVGAEPAFSTLPTSKGGTGSATGDYTAGQFLEYNSFAGAIRSSGYTGASFAPASQGATFGGSMLGSGLYVAASSGGAVTTQMSYITLTINSVTYQLFGRVP
jgi:hypothetical protein